MIFSHRVLRYAGPFLHVAALARAARRARATLAAARSPRAVGRGRAGARRALLRPHAGVDRARPLRLAAPRHRGRLVGRPRARDEAPAFDVAVAGAALLAHEPDPRARDRRDPPRVARATRSTASAASARTATPFDVLKLRTMVAGAESMGSGLAVNEGDPRITRVGAVLRRFSIDELPNLVNVLRGRHGDHRPAADRPGPGRAVHRAPARPPRGQARASPAGRRSTAARRCRGTSGSSSTSGTSSTAPGASTCGSSCGPRRSSSAARASTRARPGAGRGP